MKYLQAYPESAREQASHLLSENRLGAWLLQKYPEPHGLRSDSALFGYVQELKSQFLRGEESLSKICYDSKIQVMKHALGLHKTISRIQGHKLKTKHEIHIATLFRDAPLAFLRMIVVHELAHLRHSQHDKAFYKLCSHMEPAYAQLEFELRLYLSDLETHGLRLWQEK